MWISLVLPFLLMLVSTPALAINFKDISGVYKYSFNSGAVAPPGEPEPTFRVEDILELLEVSNNAMYFKTKLNFYNGHQCLLFGVARVVGEILVYKKADCTFNIKFSKDAIQFADVDGHCREETCGSRGGFDSAKFLLKQRRPIKYMERLKNSDDFKKSLAEFGK